MDARPRRHAGADRDRASTQKGFGDLRDGRLLRDAPAVAHRRVLRRLQAGQRRREAAAAGRDDPGRADGLDRPGRPRQQHHAPPVPRALLDPALRARRRPRRPRRRTSTRRSAARTPRCARPTSCCAVLAEQRRTIREPLPRRRRGHRPSSPTTRRTSTRFVAGGARHLAAPRPTRADDIEGQFQRFPTFLRELRPTMRLLGQAADRQTPALRTLSDDAPLLESFFDTLGPVLRGLAARLPHAGRAPPTQGRRASGPRSRRSPSCRKGVDDAARARRQPGDHLEHLDDPQFATEKDARAGRGPDGGFTGLEALLRYVFSQSQAINVFDENSYMLKVNAFLDRDCANYADVRDGARTRPRRAAARGIGPEPARHHLARLHEAAARGARARDARRAGRDGERAPTRAGSRDGDAARRRALPTRRDREAPSAPAPAPSTSCPTPTCPASTPRRSRRRPRRSSTSSWAHEAPARIHRRQPGPRRRGHHARRGRRRLPRLQREQGPAVRPDDRAEVQVANGANLLPGNEVREGG